MLKPLPKKKRHFWDNWLWVQIRLAKRELRLAEVELETAQNEVQEDDHKSQANVQLSGDMAALAEDQVKWLLDRALVRSANRWWVFVPIRNDKRSWDELPYLKRFVLAPETQHRVKEQIWQRRLTLIGFFFGLSSVVQAVFAVLSFFCRR